ncbi:reverse transcriptase domain-containing protein [Tanacetum coccineum]
MTTPMEKRNNNKFCEFHGEVRHNTDECMHLKREIEELIKAGKPSHVIKELKQGCGKDQPKAAKKGEAPGKDKAMAILMVQPWQKVKDGGEENSSSPVNSSWIKILVPGGILTLRSNMIIPLECTMVSGPEAQPSAITQAAEERIKVAIHPEYPKQTVAIGSTLTKEGRKALCGLIKRNLDIFVWKHEDMTGVPRHLAEHRLNIREGRPLVKQKKRSQAPERNKAIQEEVEKLIDASIMKEVHCYSRLLEGGIPLRVSLQKQIGRNLELYVDDLVIKSRTKQEIIRDIEETFKTLREINLKLNPKKCTFRIEEGTFLGYKVNTKGIKVCPDKVEAVLGLPFPKCLKDVHKLNGKLASLNRFLAKSAEKSLPFFKTFKKCTKKSDFQWTTKAEAAFKEMKTLIAELPMLATPGEG